MVCVAHSLQRRHAQALCRQLQRLTDAAPWAKVSQARQVWVPCALGSQHLQLEATPHYSAKRTRILCRITAESCSVHDILCSPKSMFGNTRQRCPRSWPWTVFCSSQPPRGGSRPSVARCVDPFRAPVQGPAASDWPRSWPVHKRDCRHAHDWPGSTGTDRPPLM